MGVLKSILKRYLGMEGLDTAENDRVLHFGLALAVLAVLLRFVFWYYTRRDWEDSLITVLHSENFVRGLGLSHYHPGETPLHGFTSPLSVLIPLAGDVFRAGFGLSFIKLASAFAGGLAVLFALAIAIHPRIKLPGPLAAMAMGYLAIEHHQILWGMAGMETQIATTVLLASLYYTIAQRSCALGISLGLCMLARPDFAFWTIIAGFYLLLAAPCPGTAKIRRFAQAVGVALAVYLPWIVFTTLYYGSPIPNTIIAKSLGYRLWLQEPGLTWAKAAGHIAERITGSYEFDNIVQLLGPAFAGHGNHFQRLVHDGGLICDAMVLLAAIGGIAVCVRRQRAWYPVLAFVLVYGLYYIFAVACIFGWYVVPFAAMTLLLSIRGLQALSGVLRRSAAHVALGLAAFAYVGVFAAVLPKTFTTEKQIQEIVENQVRKRVGLHLGEVMNEDQAVGCEPLGYMAYYSRRTVYDWPGLDNRHVVAYSKNHPEGRSLMAMLEYFRPDFIMLRDFMYARYHYHRWLDEDYRVMASFEAPWDAAEKIFGVDQNGDLSFLVLAKHTTGAVGPGIAPDHPRAHNSRGVRLANQDRLDEAIEELQAAVRVAPRFASAHNNLGKALARKGRAGDAAAAFEEAIRLDPTLAAPYYNLGNLLAASGKVREATAHYLESVRLDPSNRDAYVNLGVAMAIAHRYEKAVRYYQKALDIDPQCLKAYNDLASVYVALRRFDEAVVCCNKALEIDPGNTEITVLRTRILSGADQGVL